MKTTIDKSFVGIAFLGLVLAATPVAMAQTPTSVTTATTSSGTIQEFSPDSISVTTEASPQARHFTFSKTTTYVDENGNPVSVETIRSGAPVTVYYSGNSDRPIVSKVVVRKSVSSDGSASQTTTTASSAGTVSSFGDSMIAVKADPLATPVDYSFTKTTTYVDENGNPVSVDTVKSGAPVTVFYDRDGDKLVARRVMVHSSFTVNPDGSTVEHKKTTTTTTSTDTNP